MENNEHITPRCGRLVAAGCTTQLVNTHLTAPEIAYIVDDSGAKAVISSAAMRAVCEQLPITSSPAAVIATANSRVAALSGVRAAEPDTPIADERDGQLLQYSAGSTGRPKGIRRPLNSGECRPCRRRCSKPSGVSRDSVYLSPAPIYHTAPAMWTMAAQAVGATTVVMERFDAEQALDSIQRYRVTHAQFVPSMFVRMLRLPEATRQRYDLSSLQRVVHAAAPCPPEIKRQMIEWWGPIVDEYYGSSEGAGISFIRAEEWLERPGSVGKPMLGVPHILDERGSELPVGEIGEIYYEGGYPFEYLNDQAKTAASAQPRGLGDRR